ncbi:hypothetical protein, partial [Pseudomonas sp. PH1b]|uniref:hypothetical protein n=1 Tax=Pseudomonas sp. PH1b TaxID=1397282 RepID=UPI0015A5596A
SNPQEVIAAFNSAKQDAENLAFLYELQGNPGAALEVRMKWATEFALNFAVINRVGKLGKVANSLRDQELAAKGSTSSPVWSSSEGAYGGKLTGKYSAGSTTVNGKVVDSTGDFTSGLAVTEASGSAKLLEEADRRLKEYIGTFGSYKPPTVIGAVDTQTGSIVTASSGSVPSKIAPELIEYAENLGGLGVKTGCGNTLGRCAEFRAANELLLNNPKLKLADIKFTSAIRPRTGEVVKRCENCTNMFGGE